MPGLALLKSAVMFSKMVLPGSLVWMSHQITFCAPLAAAGASVGLVAPEAGAAGAAGAAAGGAAQAANAAAPAPTLRMRNILRRDTFTFNLFSSDILVS